MNSGNFSIFIARSLATRSALRSYGIRTSIVNLVVRSTRVATCDAFAFPMIKSPSQKPGTARSSASAGRSLMFTMSRIFPLLHEARDLLTRLALPSRSASFSSVRNSPRACKVQRLIDRLVGHPHLRIVGMSHHEPGTDLLRRPFPGQSTVHLVMQPPGRHELVLPGSRTLRITTTLRTNDPIRIRTAIPLDLPRNRRMMANPSSARYHAPNTPARYIGKSAPAPQQSMPEIRSHNILPIGRRNPRILSGCRYDGLTPSCTRFVVTCPAFPAQQPMTNPRRPRIHPNQRGNCACKSTEDSYPNTYAVRPKPNNKRCQ